MKQLEDLYLPFVAAAGMVSPFAALRDVYAPVSAHTHFWMIAEHVSNVFLVS